MNLEAALRSIAATLEGVDWALVGGLALAARVEARQTLDIDLAVDVAEDTAESLIDRLEHQGFPVHKLLEDEATGKIVTVRLHSSESKDGPLIDLLFTSCGIEREVVVEAEPIEVAEDFVVPIVQLGHLLAMKILARDDPKRRHDLEDITKLLKAAPWQEVGRARNALTLMARRGYQRDRDLLRELWELGAPERAP
ncbi:MAG: nucleotidyl transferase AbiEii/AbiGii toxin family protein [Acidobacteriota bacterium]